MDYDGLKKDLKNIISACRHHRAGDGQGEVFEK